ncbi:hypothetical protein AZE42_09296 [Rhizopogon vesiculosus]|uniref:CoA-transferase family III n=1 Tax=Rhizopogon vesiculosus TaxID=180088 RepID=A0A1J8PYV0_9AGAM|nr:hypothetical protein AZE42_09296 [Rhizopogon vesiculosus]
MVRITSPSCSSMSISIARASIRCGTCHIAGSRKISTVTTDPPPSRSVDLPLSGIRVLELGQLIAGPFCGQLLGHFGAEIIKVEPPSTGDPLRVWRELDIDGTSPWFRSLARNKKSVAIDLRKEEGRQIVKQLAVKSDVIIENFKPGTLEKWGLGPEELYKENPSLIFTRVSGYGQTGPWSSRPGYASPDPNTGLLLGPPTRPNISLGDSVAGLHAAFGTVLALLAKQKNVSQGRQGGQTVDYVELDGRHSTGVRGPSGSSVTGIVPTNAYPCLPSPSTSTSPTYVIIGANGDTLYARLMRAIGREDLIGPAFAHNHHRVARQVEIEEAISAWTGQRHVEEVLTLLDVAGVPVGRVVSVKEIVEGEQVKARGAVEDVWVGGEGDGWNVKMPKVFPVLDGCDAKTRWAGPDLGAHTEEVLRDLGLSVDHITRLRDDGVIG